MNIDRDHFKTFSAGLIMGLVVAGGLCAWNTLNRVTNFSLPFPPAKELAKVDKETLKCVPVIVYKDRAKKELNLPDPVKADPEKKVLGATQVAASERPTTVSAVLDTGTGETAFYQRRDSLPWLSFARKGTLGVSYGIQDDGETAARLDASYRILAVKRLNLGLIGDVSTTGRAFVGGHISF